MVTLVVTSFGCVIVIVRKNGTLRRPQKLPKGTSDGKVNGKSGGRGDGKVNYIFDEPPDGEQHVDPGIVGSPRRAPFGSRFCPVT